MHSREPTLVAVVAVPSPFESPKSDGAHRQFVVTGPERIVFGVGASERIATELDEVGARRVLLVGGSRRPETLDRLQAALGDRVVGRFVDIAPQVPTATAQAAIAAARATQADWLLVQGGGSAIGVAKAVARSVDVKIAVIPTTYSGSERTAIWGITEDGVKTTGRDDPVRPSLVVYDPALTTGLPIAVSLPSLLNAMAHAVEALYAADATPKATEAARDGLGPLFTALEALTRDPADLDARSDALYGAYCAGTALDGAAMALHHKLCHVLGGSFDTPHAQTHAVLLPYTLAFNAPAAPAMVEALASAFGHDDPAAALYDRARALGLPTDLRALGFTEEQVPAAVELALQRRYANPRPLDAPALEQLLLDAVCGRRPSRHRRTQPLGSTVAPHDAPRASTYGAPLERATTVVLAVHGRGSNADRFATDLLATLPPRLRRQSDRQVTVLASQAHGGRWYPKGFTAPLPDNQPDLDAALAALDAAWSLAAVNGRRVLLVGFSQGACLLLGWLSQRPAVRPAGVVALAGAHIEALHGTFDHLAGVPIELSVSAADRWIGAEPFARTRAALRAAGADVTARVRPGDDHRITTADEAALCRHWEATMNDDALEYQAGFGNALSTEARAGALPREQNAPREAPFGLMAEQINGTGFTADRAHNRRTWMYRLRAQILDQAFEPYAHPRFTGRFDQGRVSPQVMRYRPMELPGTSTEGSPEGPTGPTHEPVDWLAGLTTFAGAGDPAVKRGMAIHLYAANADMTRKALCNADGDLLIVPEHGRLRIQTELGWLALRPGEVAILPRGIRFRVELPDQRARGFVAELFDGHFRLPDRGLVGANGLADERHFLAPVAAFEDVTEPFEIVVKQGGDLWRVTSPYSPFDVVAWHGNYAPFKYDLSRFNSFGSVSFDHADPSILTVLTCPGTDGNAIDVGVFQRRWDVTEHTFRPPFFHRNAAIEFNGVIQTDATEGPWIAGTFSYTPYHSPHGISATGVRQAVAASDEPELLSAHSMWIQFESTYALRVMPWSLDLPNRDADYLSSFSGYPEGKVD